MKKVLFVSSTGGHLNELLQLKKVMGNYDSYIITEKTKSTVGLYKEFGSRISFFKYGSRAHFSYIYIFPFKYVPVAKITAFTLYIAPIFVSTAETFPFSTFISTISACLIDRFSF